MIKRVEGGGLGMVNPMGWYDAERGSPAQEAAPITSSFVGPGILDVGSDGEAPMPTESPAEIATAESHRRAPYAGEPISEGRWSFGRH